MELLGRLLSTVILEKLPVMNDPAPDVPAEPSEENEDSGPPCCRSRTTQGTPCMSKPMKGQRRCPTHYRQHLQTQRADRERVGTQTDAGVAGIGGSISSDDFEALLSALVDLGIVAERILSRMYFSRSGATDEVVDQGFSEE